MGLQFLASLLSSGEKMLLYIYFFFIPTLGLHLKCKFICLELIPECPNGFQMAGKMIFHKGLPRFIELPVATGRRK